MSKKDEAQNEVAVVEAREVAAPARAMGRGFENVSAESMRWLAATERPW